MVMGIKRRPNTKIRIMVMNMKMDITIINMIMIITIEKKHKIDLNIK